MEILQATDVAEIRLSYKSNIPVSIRAKITSSKDAYDLFLRKWNTNKIEMVEEFKVLVLNRAYHALGEFKLSSGGSTGTVVDLKFIYAAAIKTNACGIILAHNHPSGNLKPSEADIRLTKQIRDAGKLLEIAVLDHLIVTKEGYYSFADQGMI